MPIKTIKKYSLKRLENLNKLLSKPIDKSSVDILHQIRIEIKKLYAVKRFLEHRNLKFLNKKTSSELDELFSKSGKIREIQVALELMQTKFPEIKDHGIIDLLKKKSDRYLANFNNKYIGYTIDEKNLTAKKIKNDTLTLINYITKLKKSKQLISKGPAALPSMIHNIRVNLKDAIYLSTLLPSKKSDKNDVTFILALGKWHDYISLRKIIIKTMAKTEFNELSIDLLTMVINKTNQYINSQLNRLLKKHK